ncbi:MAG: hypothetical protein WCJ35_20445 [Planctomycetota bacterium]
MEDLSLYHHPVTSMFRVPGSSGEWQQYALTEEQLDFYRREGYVSGLRLLTDEQVDMLCEELTPLFDPGYPRHDLFHEFHSNESKDANTVLFHALGAWRVARAFHDILWNPAFRQPSAKPKATPVTRNKKDDLVWYMSDSFPSQRSLFTHFAYREMMQRIHRRAFCKEQFPVWKIGVAKPAFR